jgi:glycosyltransferase involved in cell wall biosynthesis
LRRLLEDEPLRRRLGSAGRQRAETMFGVEAHAERVLLGYRQVLSH